MTGKDPDARQAPTPASRPTAAPWREPAAALVLFSLLSALFTYPLVLHLADAVEDGQDALLNVWILAWDGHALFSDPLRLFDANIFYPFSRALAYSEINLSQALLALPATLISGNPVLGYNLALLFTFVLSGWGMYLLAGRLTGSPWAGLGAGIVFAFNAYKLSNLAQIQLLSLHWLPFALLFLDRLLRPTGPTPARSLRASWGDILAVAIFLALQALASFYYALFAALAVGLFIACRFATNRHLITRDNLARLGLAGGLAVAVVLPFAVPYFQVQSEMGFARTLAESEPFSASLRLYAEALPNNLLYGRWLAPQSAVVIGGYPLDALFPGVVALVVAAVGAVLALRAWRASLFYLLLVPLSFVLSLGPKLYLAPGASLDLPFSLPYAWLYAVVPGFQALRAPERFSALGFLGLAVLVGYALTALTRPGPGQARGRLLAGIAVALLGLECLTFPAAQVYPVPTGDAVPPVYRWLAAQPPTTILELPLGDRDATRTLRYQYLSTYHWQRTPDGYSGFIPPKHGEMVYEMASFPSERAMALLRGYGVQYVVIHGDQWPSAQLAVVPGLRLVQTFGGDRVYQVQPGNSRPVVSLSSYLPPLATPGGSYAAYVIITRNEGAPLVVLPTHHPAVTVTWTLANGQTRTDTVLASLPIVTSEATVLAVRTTAPSDAKSVSIHLDDPLLGAIQAAQDVRVAQSPTGQPFPVPVRLQALAVPAATVQPGDTISVSLTWHALGKIDAYYSAFAALLDWNNRPVTRQDGEPRNGKRPTLLWQPGEDISDQYALTLPANASPGAYRVEVGLYRASDLAPALTLDGKGQVAPRLLSQRIKAPLQPITARPRQTVSAQLEDKIALLGYDTAQSGKEFAITLYWR
ncbi:MAG: hypothetical protein Q8O07_04155, partial [Chloroflexota bacterium]|nr:hypothetical protein [Chloroflexota bacterium]